MATATDTDSVAAEHANGIATGFEWRFFDDEDGSVANGKNLHRVMMGEARFHSGELSRRSTNACIVAAPSL